MSDARRPWWASDPDDGAVASGGDDPVTAHRAARRGPSGDPTSDEDADARDATAGSDRGDGAAEDDGAAGSSGRAHDHGACEVCPLCALLRTLDDSRPELVAHLSEAARHLLAAARVIMEPPAEPRDPSTPPTDDGATSTRQGPQRIDLDP